jgi:hypothetical protein
VNPRGYEVVWPLDRRHYLTVEAHPIIMRAAPPAPATPAITAITVASQTVVDGRRLAAKALLLGAHCSQRRVIALLRVSRWTLDRITHGKTVTGLPEPEVLEMAQTCLEESTNRGSTAEERQAARAWLQTPTIPTPITAETPDANVGRDVRNATAIVAPPGAAVATPAAADSGRRPRVASSYPSAEMTSAVERAKNDAHASLALKHLETVSQQQRRILHRTVILDYALKAEALDLCMLRAALAELVSDINDAARAIGVIVQQATHGTEMRGQ